MKAVTTSESSVKEYEGKWNNGWRWKVKKIALLVLWVPSWISFFIIVGGFKIYFYYQEQ